MQAQLTGRKRDLVDLAAVLVFVPLLSRSWLLFSCCVFLSYVFECVTCVSIDVLESDSMQDASFILCRPRSFRYAFRVMTRIVERSTSSLMIYLLLDEYPRQLFAVSLLATMVIRLYGCNSNLLSMATQPVYTHSCVRNLIPFLIVPRFRMEGLLVACFLVAVSDGHFLFGMSWQSLSLKWTLLKTLGVPFMMRIISHVLSRDLPTDVFTVLLCFSLVAMEVLRVYTSYRRVVLGFGRTSQSYVSSCNCRMETKCGQFVQLQYVPFVHAPISWFGHRVLAAAWYYLSRLHMIEGLHPDPRRLMAATQLPARMVDADFSTQSDLWFDFIADTGECSVATYSVAVMLAAPCLVLDDVGQLPQGSLVLHGGDMAYPFLNPRTLSEKFESIYAAAAMCDYQSVDVIGSHAQKQSPSFFAVPGNHDWLDNLSTFEDRFCNGGNFAGKWQLRQSRSYYAIALPHNWWIFGLDTGRATYGDIDSGQEGYFLNVVRKSLSCKSSVILITHAPEWCSSSPIPPPRLAKLYNTLGDRLRLRIAGDQHHYARYRPVDDGASEPMLVVSGGGGAHLNPTHGSCWEHPSFQGSKYVPAVMFPSPEVSQSLGSIGEVVRFGQKNAGLTLVCALLLHSSCLWLLENDIPHMQIVVGFLLLLPFSLVVAGSFSSFRRCVSLTCFVAVTYSASVFAMYHWYSATCRNVLSSMPLSLSWLQTAVIHSYFVLSASSLFSLLVGGFLFVLSSRWSDGRSAAATYSSLRQARFQNFLRIHCRLDGALDVYVVGQIDPADAFAECAKTSVLLQKCTDADDKKAPIVDLARCAKLIDQFTVFPTATAVRVEWESSKRKLSTCSLGTLSEYVLRLNDISARVAFADSIVERLTDKF